MPTPITEGQSGADRPGALPAGDRNRIGPIKILDLFFEKGL
jgi:hypothetical protein